jgi:hypothetical protein
MFPPYELNGFYKNRGSGELPMAPVFKNIAGSGV